MLISHVKSNTILDGADTTVVRPSDWNSSHAVTIASTDILGVTALGGSLSTGLLSFANSNGVSFGIAPGATATLTASVAGGATSMGLTATGNTAGSTSSETQAITAQTLSGGGIASVGFSGGSVIISATSAASQGGFSLVAVGNTTGATSSSSTSLPVGLTFSGGGIASVGMSLSTVIVSVASGASANTMGLAAIGNTTALSSSMSQLITAQTISGAGIVSVGMSNTTLVISATAPAASATSMGMTALGGTAGSTSSQTNALTAITFSGSGNASVGFSGGTVIISASAPAASATSMGLTAVGNTTGTTSSMTQALTAESFSGSGGVSVGFSGGSIIVAGQTSATSEGATAVGNTTALTSSQTQALTTFVISGAGNVSVGFSNSTLVVSGGTAAPAGITQTLFASSQTAGTTTSASIANSQITFVGSNGVSVGFSGSSVIVKDGIMSFLEPVNFVNVSTIAESSSVLFLQPMSIPDALTINQIRMFDIAGIFVGSLANTSTTSTASNSIAQSLWWMIYSLANSTSLTLVGSTSAVWSYQESQSISGTTTAATQTQNRSVTHTFAWNQGTVTTSTSLSTSSNTSAFINAAGVTSFTGTMRIDIPFATSLTPGFYIMGYFLNSASGGAGVGGVRGSWSVFQSIFYNNAGNLGAFKTFGQGTNASNIPLPGLGSFTLTSTTTTNSIAMSNINVIAGHQRHYFYGLNES